MFPTSAKALRQYSQTGLTATHQRARVIKSEGDPLRSSNRAGDLAADVGGTETQGLFYYSFLPRTWQVLMQIQCSVTILRVDEQIALCVQGCVPSWTS